MEFSINYHTQIISRNNNTKLKKPAEKRILNEKNEKMIDCGSVKTVSSLLFKLSINDSIFWCSNRTSFILFIENHNHPTITIDRQTNTENNLLSDIVP